MSGEFCVSIEDLAAAAGLTVQAGAVATDELFVGESRINGCSPDTFRGPAGSALGEFSTYLADRRKSLDVAVDDLVQGLRLAAATFDATETASQQGMSAIQQSVGSSRISVLKL